MMLRMAEPVVSEPAVMAKNISLAVGAVSAPSSVALRTL